MNDDTACSPWIWKPGAASGAAVPVQVKSYPSQAVEKLQSVFMSSRVSAALSMPMMFAVCACTNVSRSSCMYEGNNPASRQADQQDLAMLCVLSYAVISKAQGIGHVEASCGHKHASRTHHTPQLSHHRVGQRWTAGGLAGKLRLTSDAA